MGRRHRLCPSDRGRSRNLRLGVRAPQIWFAGLRAFPGTALTDNILLVREEEPSTLPGLRFALPPASPGELSAVQWDWTCDPSVLAVTALPARQGDRKRTRLHSSP